MIGYLDRVKKQIRHVPLRELFFEAGDHFSFDLIDDEGRMHCIPLHRIREVYKDGALIWQRGEDQLYRADDQTQE